MVRSCVLCPLVLATLALVAIGAVESFESARQLADQPGRGRPSLGPGGTALTLAGALLSAGVFVALGLVLSRDEANVDTALRHGAIAGVAAGLLGGTVRALAVSDYLGETIGRFGLPAGFLVITLAIFVALSATFTGAVGAGLTWLGFRSGRRRPPRPPP